MELSPERKLLLACARSKLTPEDHRRIADLAGVHLDWDQLVSVSYAHGIAPLIYHSLVKSDVIGQVPATAAQTLRSSYYTNTARNSLLYDDLKRLLLALRQEKINAIVLKGAALAETVYAHRALRPMLDIDLLVRKEKVAEVETKLLAMGYFLDERERSKRYYQQHHYHFPFTKSSAISTEIHWHIKRPIDPFKIDIDGLWERSQPINIADVEALLFAPEDLVLYLCQHFWKHRLEGGIRPICDIAEVATYYRDKIDWQRVASISAQWEMNSCSYLGLWLARELLDAPIPEELLRDLRPANFNLEVTSWARERVLAHGERPLVFPDLLELLWKGRSAKQRWAILQRILSRQTVAAYANDASASKQAYVYYPLRIKRLLTRYGPAAYGLLAGNKKMRTAVEAAADREVKQQRLAKWLSEVSFNE